jgi:hypothetical protein
MQENSRLTFVSNLIKEKLQAKLSRLESRNKDELNDLTIIQKEFGKLESKI